MRPNILLITTDQQRPDSLHCYGSAWMRTPHLDRLAAEGVRFDRAYCTNPVCTPSRASLFSGLMPSRHGAWNIGCNVPADVPFLSHRLAAAGYATAHLGKAHWQAQVIPPDQSRESLLGPRTARFDGAYYGFDHVELANGHPGYNLRSGQHAAWVEAEASSPAEFAAWQRLHRHGADFGGNAYDSALPLRLHNSVWTADRALAFLDQATATSDRPFFLHLGFQDPHHPHALPTDFTDRIDPATIPPPRWQSGELDDKPAHFRAAREGRLETAPTRGTFPMAGQNTGHDYRQVDPDSARLARAHYYGMVQLLDTQIGRVLAALERHGLADNTLVLFTSDHGELLGDHGLWLKGAFLYEQVVRVPLLARWPARWAAGQTVTAPISLCDIAPTVLAATATPDREELDGVSWHDHLTRRIGTPPRDHVHVECLDDPATLHVVARIEDRWKLCLHLHSGEGELYDLQHDPAELQNLFADPASGPTRARLEHALRCSIAAPHHRQAARLCYS